MSWGVPVLAGFRNKQKRGTPEPEPEASSAFSVPVTISWQRRSVCNFQQQHHKQGKERLIDPPTGCVWMRGCLKCRGSVADAVLAWSHSPSLPIHSVDSCSVRRVWFPWQISPVLERLLSADFSSPEGRFLQICELRESLLALLQNLATGVFSPHVGAAAGAGEWGPAGSSPG